VSNWISRLWGAQAASLPFAAACREKERTWLKMQTADFFERDVHPIRQAAGSCRLAACAPQSETAPNRRWNGTSSVSILLLQS